MASNSYDRIKPTPARVGFILYRKLLTQSKDIHLPTVESNYYNSKETRYTVRADRIM